MIAGGSGITPCLSVVRAVMQNPSDKTEIHLIYCNVSVEDIIFKEELDSYVRSRPDQFKLYYVIDSVSNDGDSIQQIPKSQRFPVESPIESSWFF
jgi:ferredoxin-NADP reductase